MIFKQLFLRNRFFYLLASLIIFFVLNPLLIDSQVTAYVIAIFFTITLFFSVYVIKPTKWLIIPAIFLGLLTVLGFWGIILWDLDATMIGIEFSIAAVFFLLITIIVLTYVIQDTRITFSSLCGAICGYLLLGMFWATTYSVVHVFDTQAFTIAHLSNNKLDNILQIFIYYSFVTLTTLGYGDITPVSNIARTFAWLEAVVGQIYLTVWLAQLVGLHIAQRMRQRDQT